MPAICLSTGSPDCRNPRRHLKKKGNVAKQMAALFRLLYGVEGLLADTKRSACGCNQASPGDFFYHHLALYTNSCLNLRERCLQFSMFCATMQMQACWVPPSLSASAFLKMARFWQTVMKPQCFFANFAVYYRRRTLGCPPHSSVWRF